MTRKIHSDHTAESYRQFDLLRESPRQTHHLSIVSTTRNRALPLSIRS